jgi:hypothetical protein
MATCLIDVSAQFGYPAGTTYVPQAQYIAWGLGTASTPCSLQTDSPVPAPIDSGFFTITPAEGLQLSAAIVAVWAIGFVVRLYKQSLNIDEKET